MQQPSQDPIEFIKQLWANLGTPVPAALTNALDPNELERRITELRAVENWLKLNLTLLQSTIQGFEIQLATLNMLKAQSTIIEQATNRDTSEQTQASAQAFAQTGLWPLHMMQSASEAFNAAAQAMRQTATPTDEAMPKSTQEKKSATRKPKNDETPS